MIKLDLVWGITHSLQYASPGWASTTLYINIANLSTIRYRFCVYSPWEATGDSRAVQRKGWFIDQCIPYKQYRGVTQKHQKVRVHITPFFVHQIFQINSVHTTSVMTARRCTTVRHTIQSILLQYIYVRENPTSYNFIYSQNMGHTCFVRKKSARLFNEHGIKWAFKIYQSDILAEYYTHSVIYGSMYLYYCLTYNCEYSTTKLLCWKMPSSYGSILFIKWALFLKRKWNAWFLKKGGTIWPAKYVNLIFQLSNVQKKLFITVHVCTTACFVSQNILISFGYMKNICCK